MAGSVCNIGVYDLSQDRSELRDLVDERGAVRDELLALWQDWAGSVGARPWPAVQAARKAYRQRRR